MYKVVRYGDRQTYALKKVGSDVTSEIGVGEHEPAELEGARKCAERGENIGVDKASERDWVQGGVHTGR